MSLTLFRNLFSCLLDPGNLTPSNDDNFSKNISQCFFQSVPAIISGFMAIINYPSPFLDGHHHHYHSLPLDKKKISCQASCK